MGPWAPKRKPYLGIGPIGINAETQQPEGWGPCIVERLLRFYKRWRETAFVPMQLAIATGDLQGTAACVDMAAHSPFEDLLDGVVLLQDYTGKSGPLSALRCVPRGSTVLLHNGDDLIREDALASFLAALYPVPKPRVGALLCAKVQQRGEYGVVRVEQGLHIDEKPVLATDSIGVGVLVAAPELVELALEKGIGNSSTLLNAAQERGLFVDTHEIDESSWRTVGNPRQYEDACNDVLLTKYDACWQAWHKGHGSHEEATRMLDNRA